MKQSKPKNKLTQVKKILEFAAENVEPAEISTDGFIDHNKLEKNKIFQQTVEQLKALDVDYQYLRSRALINAAIIYGRYLR